MTTVVELKKKCKQRGLTGYSKLNKTQLLELVKSKKVKIKTKKIKKTQRGGKNVDDLLSNLFGDPEDDEERAAELLERDTKDFQKDNYYDTSGEWNLRKSVKNAKIDHNKIKRLSKKIKLTPFKGKIDHKFYDMDYAADICRHSISPKYIEKVMKNPNIEGYLASHVDGDDHMYIGFILYQKKTLFNNRKTLFLDLVCSAKDKRTKGIPIGQLLIYKMEEFAREKGIGMITLEAVPDAMEFYKSIGYRPETEWNEYGFAGYERTYDMLIKMYKIIKPKSVKQGIADSFYKMLDKYTDKKAKISTRMSAKKKAAKKTVKKTVKKSRKLFAK